MSEEVCQFCGRQATKTSKGYSLCRYHILAYGSLETGFRAWKERIGEMAWTNYLRRVSELADTGEWVKDIARAELQKLES